MKWGYFCLCLRCPFEMSVIRICSLFGSYCRKKFVSVIILFFSILLVLFIGNILLAEDLSISNPLEFSVQTNTLVRSPAFPQQIHVSVGSSSLEYTIQWVQCFLSEHNASNSALHVGKRHTSLTGECKPEYVRLPESDANTAYQAQDLNAKFKNCFVYLCKVEISARTDIHHLWYQITTSFGDKSAVFAFRHLPNYSYSPKYREEQRLKEQKRLLPSMVYSGSSVKEFSFAFFGGLGPKSSYLHDVMYTLTQKLQVHVMFQLGDIIGEHFNEHDFGDSYLQTLEPYISRVLIAPVPGIADSKPNSLFRYKFCLPHNKCPMLGEPLFYGLKTELVNFIVLNTALLIHESVDGDDHIRVLNDQLISANRTRAKRPWVIVLMHEPLYSFAKNQPPPTFSYRSELKDIFDSFGVDVVLQGKDSHYARSHPINNGKSMANSQSTSIQIMDPKGTIYITLANFANHDRITGIDTDHSLLDTGIDGEGTESSGVFTVKSPNMLDFSLYEAKSGRVLDHFVLIQRCHKFIDGCPRYIV